MFGSNSNIYIVVSWFNRLEGVREPTELRQKLMVTSKS